MSLLIWKCALTALLKSNVGLGSMLALFALLREAVLHMHSFLQAVAENLASAHFYSFPATTFPSFRRGPALYTSRRRHCRPAQASRRRRARLDQQHRCTVKPDLSLPSFLSAKYTNNRGKAHTHPLMFIL